MVMKTSADRSATQALIQQELAEIAQRVRQAQDCAEAGALEQAVAVAAEVADMAWGLSQILDAEALLNRLV